MKNLFFALLFIPLMSIGQVKKTYSSTGELERKVEHNSNGKIIEDSYYADEKIIFRTVYEYDEKGNRISQKNYGKKGSLSDKYYYKYDNNNNNTEELYHYGLALSLSMKKVFEYENGKKIKEIWYQTERFTVSYSYEYDEKGRLISEVEVWANGRTTKYYYEWNKEKSRNVIKKEEILVEGDS